MKKLVVLSGAGMSAESGIQTFRDMGGLWNQYDVMEVASPHAWKKNPNLVHQFYNERRKQLFNCFPNKGHLLIAELEKHYEVEIVTQNVDDLHERAGSSNVLHLHGELKKARSTADPELIYDLDHWELTLNDTCEKGSPLRPHIVWFGESVPAISEAVAIVSKADVFVIVGTSLNVYPAAGLIDYIPNKTPVYVIDPNQPLMRSNRNITYIREKASVGMEKLFELLH
ncbi:SIR2 family NAD-dependent protein deacylase [Labilibaculum euxinus]|uniref:NAD-dependent protein deacylase n=1 Tax=Labilibaculum euxinus TaxID=2686357 RepID=A0A7M4D2F8_9BACT|nr:NAD-dependent deacylase [Labilibaculum euxinus]MUP36837.1 NAD-dependent deacylase [Labilibaculum euxinus]MVB06042.1 NAD-dependent deacylase [Labilibaculum euxinus]